MEEAELMEFGAIFFVLFVCYPKTSIKHVIKHYRLAVAELDGDE